MAFQWLGKKNPQSMVLLCQWIFFIVDYKNTTVKSQKLFYERTKCCVVE